MLWLPLWLPQRILGGSDGGGGGGGKAFNILTLFSGSDGGAAARADGGGSAMGRTTTTTFHSAGSLDSTPSLQRPLGGVEAGERGALGGSPEYAKVPSSAAAVDRDREDVGGWDGSGAEILQCMFEMLSCLSNLCDIRISSLNPLSCLSSSSTRCPPSRE